MIEKACSWQFNSILQKLHLLLVRVGDIAAVSFAKTDYLIVQQNRNLLNKAGFEGPMGVKLLEPV